MRVTARVAVGILSILLALCVVAPLGINAAEAKLITPSDELPEIEELETVESAVPAYLSLIDRESAEEYGHIGRVESRESGLNSIVMRNNDGSMTEYIFSENVKYVDENGEICDKKLSLIPVSGKVTDYAYETGENDVHVYFPSALGNTVGVKLENDEVALELIPIVTKSNTDVAVMSADESETQLAVPKLTSVDVNTSSVGVKQNAVDYAGAFDSTTTLRYTPTPNGFKEELVLSACTGKNEHSFKLKTAGLRPVELDGAYFLEDPTSSEVKLSVGELLVYDGNGNELNTGYEHRLSFTTVTENEEYILKIKLDRACLENAETAYPVTVDLSFEVLSDNDAIIDTAVRATGAAYSDSLNNGVGHHNTLLEDMRSFIKFPGLLENETFGSIPPPGVSTAGEPEITSVKLQLYSRGTSIVDTYVSVYKYDASGSLDWTNATKKFTTAQFNALGSFVSKTKVPYSKNVWVDFDITGMVGRSGEERGIVLVNQFEGEDNEPAYQSFASTADPTNKPRIVVTWTGEPNTSFDTATFVSAGSSFTVSPSSTSEKLYYSFTPTEDAFYTIESSDCQEDCTPSAHLYNADQNPVVSSSKISSTDNNCRLIYHLSKDTTYYIEMQCSGSVGTYELSFRKTSDLSILSYKTELEKDVESSAVTVVSGGRKYFTFTPDDTCSYTIASSKNKTYDPQGWLYDSSGKLIASDDDSGTENNFSIKAVLTKGNTYYIAVVFKDDGIKNCKVTASVTIPEAPLTLTSSSVTGNSVKLTWTMPSGYSVDRWLVQKRVKGSTDWENAKATNTKPVTVSGLSASTAYEFRVISEVGSSAWQGVHFEPSVTITVTTLPAQPTSLTVSDITTSSLKLTWSTASPHGADRWVVEYRKSGGTWSRHGTSTYKGYVVTGLSVGTTYEFRVYAERDASSTYTAANSLVSSTVTATTKANNTVQKMLDNIRNGTAISADKKETCLLAAETLLNEGYEPAFVAGVLGNIVHKSKIGYFEEVWVGASQGYINNFSGYLQENYGVTYENMFAGKYIYDMDFNLVYKIFTELANMNFNVTDAQAEKWSKGATIKIGAGIGCVGWTFDRSYAIITKYREECGSSGTISKAQTEKAEMKLILEELTVSYPWIYNNWKAKYASSLATQNAACAAGESICCEYEMPENYESKASERGDSAGAIYLEMIS